MSPTRDKGRALGAAREVPGNVSYRLARERVIFGFRILRQDNRDADTKIFVPPRLDHGLRIVALRAGDSASIL